MIELTTLGPVAVTVDGAPPPPELLWRKNLALLVYLAQSPRRTRARDHLVALLWADRPETAARHSLREAIRQLRAAVGEDGLVAEGPQLRLSDAAVSLDTDQFARLSGAGDWDGAAALARGEFLEGFGVPDASQFEDWLTAERNEWRRRAVDALVRAAARRMRSGDAEGAAGCAGRALAIDNCAEEAARVAMAAASLAGDRTRALQVFDDLAAKLHATLGAQPDATTRELAERIRAARQVAAPARAAASRGAETRRAPFTGRERELAALIEGWERCRTGHGAAVLAVLGDAGTGRSRLLDELAQRVRLEGATVVAARAVPADRGTRWSGALAIAAGGLLDAPGLGAASPGALAPFVAALPEWQQRFPGAMNTTGLPLSAALANVLRAVAEERPTLVVLDDAQYLDAGSLEAVEAALRDLARLPLAVALSTPSHGAADELTALLARVGRDVPGGTVKLTALDQPALAALAHWAMPAHDAAAVARLARRLAADSAGLPLLAVELLHAVALGLELRPDGSQWPVTDRTLDQTLPGELPDTVIAAIRVGFRRLSKDAQAALAAMSVLDDPAPAALIGRAADLTGDRLAAALDELEWERWVAAGPRGYGFVARLARHVVTTDLMTPGQRRRLLSRTGLQP